MKSNKKHDDIYNKSGYVDITAYEAIKNVRREEKRQLISALKDLANQHGYRIVSIISLEEMDGDTYV